MNRMIARVFACATVAVLLAAGPVSAKNGFYVGASLGQTFLEIDNLDLAIDTLDFSANDTSYKIIAGYRFMGFVAVEASYIDFGRLVDSTTGDGETVSVEADLKGFDAAAMGMLPLGIADIFAKIGFVSWDADIRTAVGAIVNPGSESGTDMVYGLGAQVRFKGIAVRGELEYFGIADADNVYMVSVGATFTF
jgi:hypothetical protein